MWPFITRLKAFNDETFGWILSLVTFQSDIPLWDLPREVLHSLHTNPCKGQPWQMEYSHQKNNLFFYLLLLHLCFLRGNSDSEWMRTLSISVCLFSIHPTLQDPFQRCHCCSKPIKALCLLTCKWFPEDYWLRLAVSSNSSFTISNWSPYRLHNPAELGLELV